MKIALILVALVALVAFMAVLVRLSESSFAFFPIAGETTTPLEFGLPYETISIATGDGEQLRAWAIAPAAESVAERHYVRDERRARIVYFHGNGGNLSNWAPILAGITRQGYSVLAFDYRGYGKSTGYPSERGLYRDVDAVVKHFLEGPQRGVPVVYWGRSLGAAMAAYAATVRAPDGLILESAFPDGRALVRSSPPMAILSLFSTYRFPAAQFMQRVRAPVLMMHGDGDSVVPFGLGQALFETIHEPKRFFTIRGGDHNDAAPRDPRAYWEAVGEFVAAL
jgi:uncharacterized protein